MRRHSAKHKARRQPFYRRLRKWFSGFALFMLVATFAMPLFAEEAAKPEAEKAEAIGPGEKLAEGIEETATGWAEVPQEMIETSKETNPIEGVTVGTIKGAGEAVVKTTEGAVKAATFYIPEEKKQE